MANKFDKSVIPNLDNFYNELCRFVKENQDNYIDVSSALNNDVIFVTYYGVSGTIYKAEAEKIRTRTNSNGSMWLQVFFNGDWFDVRGGAFVDYIPTLFSIGESIDEYV